MNRAKFWTITGSAAVVLGLLVSAAHMASSDSATDSNRNARLARLQNLMDEGRAEYRPSIFNKKIKKSVKARLELVAGLDGGTSETSVSEIAPAKPKAAEVKKDDKKKDASKDKKKKKKKKKKTVKGSGEAQPESSSDESGDDESTTSGTRGDLGGGQNQASPAANKAVSENPETVEEWYAYILAHPDSEHVAKFIQLAQIGVVKSEVFYPVIEKLLLDPSPKMHEFAVLALGSTQSESSFTVLSDVANEPTMERKVKAQAMKYMRMYTRIEYVRHQGSVAALDIDSSTRLFAMNLVLDTARMYKDALTAAAEAPTTQDGSRTPASNVARTFDSLIRDLTRTQTTANDPAVRTAAASAISTLNALLGKS